MSKLQQNYWEEIINRYKVWILWFYFNIETQQTLLGFNLDHYILTVTT